MKALVSLYDKAGPFPLLQALHDRGVSLIATEGTARALAAHGIGCGETKDVTGFSELMGGKIKTIHPALHEAIAQGEIGMVIVGLMPVSGPQGEGLSLMDLGGVLLLRSAIKNHDKVYAVVHPSALGDDIMAALDGTTPQQDVRRRCALAAMEAVVAYEKETLQRLSAI
jgi:phosphoribosylaminoimidazolecarboxamide formyltransferase/IMP cyclohydrolase